jgi:hypothetical protein
MTGRYRPVQQLRRLQTFPRLPGTGRIDPFPDIRPATPDFPHWALMCRGVCGALSRRRARSGKRRGRERKVVKTRWTP